MKSLSLRLASLEDLPLVVNIYNQTIASRMVTGDTAPVSVTGMKQWFEGHDVVRRPLYIVDVKGGPHGIGWLSFQNFYGRPAYQATAEISLYLDQDARGKGYGSALLQRALFLAPTLQIENILAFIFAHNEVSLKLFYKYGFESWGHLPNVAVLDGVKRSLCILGKSL